MPNRGLVVRVVLVLLVVALFGIAVTWYLDKRDNEIVERINNSEQIRPDSASLQNRINQLLGNEIDEQASGLNEPLSFVDNFDSMRNKLTGMIEAISGRQPTEEELQEFFKSRQVYYGGGARLEFLYRPFLTARYGGQAFDMATKALEEMISNSVPLLKDRRLTDDGYFYGLYQPSEDEEAGDQRLEQAFGVEFKSKLTSLVEQSPDKLPCWAGPISGTHGVYLVCVKKHTVEPFANLDEVREEVINDWRLSTVRKSSRN